MRWFLVFLGGAVAGAVMLLALAASGLLDRFLGCEPAGAWGHFSGAPKAELLDDGRVLRLLEDFAYLDPRGRAWVARKDALVDGASIPQAFWTVVVGPLEGQFRNASVVHDTACADKAATWEDVHLMFYEACRCGGVTEYQAKVLYWANQQRGPRWEFVREARLETRAGPSGKPLTFTATVTRAVAVPPPAKPTEADARRVLQLVQKRNSKLDELRTLAVPRP